jgi:pyruvate kinase
MLESMITNPRPTRAEASDVANAILDGTDAVMLSGETATGRYPVEAVQMMQRIARVTEENLPYDAWLRESAAHVAHSVTEGISEAGCELAAELGAAAIIAATMSGLTARMLAKNRPRQPIIAVTPDPDLIGRLTLVWGVIPLLVPAYTSTDLMSAGSIEVARQKGLVGPDDLVVLTAGVPIGGAGRTNMIRVHRTSEAFPVA